MTDAKVNSIMSSLFEEISSSTIDKFRVFLEEKVDVDDEMKAFFDEFKTSLKSSVKAKGGKGAKALAPKKPRTLSPYNIYIKNKMSELKAQGHTGNLMKLAVEAYNEDKKNGVLPSASA
jgi:RNA binding exosome subunit